MTSKLLILLVVSMLTSGCLQVKDPGGEKSSSPNSPSAPIDSDSGDTSEDSEDELPEVEVDPLFGLTPYDAATYVDHTGMSSPVQPEVADFAMCGALADYNVRDDRTLYIRLKTGQYMQIEGVAFNYAFSVRDPNGTPDWHWNKRNCSEDYMNESRILDSGQCRLVVKNWCSNYYGPWENYMEFDVKWYHQPSEGWNSGPNTVLRSMQ